VNTQILRRHSPYLTGSLHWSRVSTINYQQLQLLVGRLKLGDKSTDLIWIDVTYVQLWTGPLKSFFTLPCPNNAKWIDWNWIVSIWKHMSQIKITVDIEHMWTPTQVWHHDFSLMEAALSYNFSPKTLQEIKQCHIYLQVIIPEALKGEALSDRSAALCRPHQELTTSSPWDKWNLFLQY